MIRQILLVSSLCVLGTGCCLPTPQCLLPPCGYAPYGYGGYGYGHGAPLYPGDIHGYGCGIGGCDYGYSSGGSWSSSGPPMATDCGCGESFTTPQPDPQVYSQPAARPYEERQPTVLPNVRHFQAPAPAVPPADTSAIQQTSLTIPANDIPWIPIELHSGEQIIAR